ncbi:hypothetical protein [Streptosporangium sandarakinum]|uniref:hypothetical protein n=1 Tax=Streptosporangium sandarakinum TaxID=1260955 RepID=UPI0036774611
MALYGGASRLARESRIGGLVVSVSSAGIGLTSSVAAVISTSQGAIFFVKAAPVSCPAAVDLLREHIAARYLPTDVPAPRLFWAADFDR